ncbi:M10 family metallopeptidase C-terminal domain-containing protein [Phyllobacterium sp. 22229]|uniref:M10 family metallopeptidase C-terminal domain-containing protein n=1 Tax=Phyllobacterium sp. 22229 TaxID=3453895 RepID=UPI003F8386B6
MSRNYDFAVQSSDLALGTLDPSFDHYVDFLRHGYWQAKGRPEYRQPDMVVQVDLTALNGSGQQIDSARMAMAKWSQMLPIFFQEVSAGSPTDIRVSNVYDGAYFDDYYGNLNVNRTWWGGDFSVGGYGYQTFIHEIGHALGLGHGGRYNGSGTFSTDAEFTYDSWQYSIMSYFTPSEAGHSYRDYYLVSPRSADVEALIRKYFVNADGTYQQVNINTSNDSYGFGGKDGFALTTSGYLSQGGFTIHDSGGWDSLDFSGSVTGTTLNLIPGTFSSVNGFVNNIDIFNGHNANPSDYFIEVGVGSAFNDVIVGNDGPNGLYGNAGDDWIRGNGGDDFLYGWTGNDSLDGSQGNDFLDGGPGDDTLYGGTGNDSLNGGEGNDIIVSSTYYGSISSGVSRIDGGDGNDTIYANGIDVVFGGAGDDTIYGNNAYGGYVYVDAGAGNDRVGGTVNGDILIGNDGEDYLFGYDGNDLLYGGNGNDVLYGGLGSDRFEGGAGADIFQFMSDIQANTVEAVADFTAGQDLFALSSAYLGQTFVQDTTNGVFISVAVNNNYWGAMVYGTHNVAAVQSSFLYL